MNCSEFCFSESGRGNCLRDPAFSINTHDHLTDGRLPGQRFTADQQCSYFWGRDYQVEIPVGRNMDVSLCFSLLPFHPFIFALGYLPNFVVWKQRLHNFHGSSRAWRLLLWRPKVVPRRTVSAVAPATLPSPESDPRRVVRMDFLPEGVPHHPLPDYGEHFDQRSTSNLHRTRPK